MTKLKKLGSGESTYYEDLAWADEAMGKAMADEIEAEETMANVALAKTTKAEVAIDDLEPLDEIPPLPPGDGLDIVRHNVFDCIAICKDDHAAGLLLFRMIFLGRYSKLQIGGYRWYVKPRRILCRDVRLTRHQYDRALAILKKLGFVQTQKVPFVLIHVFGPFTAFRVTKSAASTLTQYVKSNGHFMSKKKGK
jgi:hypothetical protein